MTLDQTVHSLQETWQTAATVAAALPHGGVIALHGDLGVGKTTFVQGVARHLGITRPVTSPTFTIVGDYRGTRQRLVHMDLYRLSGPDDLLDIGFADYLESGAIIAIEWPECAGELLPPSTIHITIQRLPQNEWRRITTQPAE